MLKSAFMKIDWTKYIDSDPEILVGKPIVKGTRLSVEFICELLSEGWSIEKILENYPQLTKEKIQAVFAYISEMCKQESFRYLRTGND